MAQTHGLLAVCEQTFEQVIDGQIAGGADQDFLAAANGVTDQLDEGRRLAGAGRTVDDGHILRGQGEPHGFALGVVERSV